MFPHFLKDCKSKKIRKLVICIRILLMINYVNRLEGEGGGEPHIQKGL